MRIIMETERVYFVAVDEEYVEFYIENMNNPEIYRHLADNPRTYTREEEIEWIRENVEANQFTIIDKNTGELIGNAGYHEIVGDTGEIGIWITPAHQNNHYGREIIMKLVEYGYDVLKVRHVTLKVHDNNERAKHVYEKVGFQRTGTEEIITDGIGNPTKNITMEYIKERR